jgi:hypothetical protein
MKQIHFLCKVLSREKDNTYKIIVNLDNMHQLPIGNVGEKLIHCIEPLKVNDTLYIHSAELDEETRQVSIKGFTVINTTETDGQEIPAELLSLANLSEITPYDMMNEIYAQEELEDEEDEEPKVPDSEDEEGS